MSKFFHLIKINRLEHRPEQQPRIFKFLKNVKFINLILLITIIAVGVSYLLVINLKATKGFETKILNERLNSLKADNQKLELRITQDKSLQSLQEKSRDLNLEKVVEVEYLQPVGSTVALAEW